MLTAINIEGKRITPHSDEQGFCPLCKSIVIKAVGEINVAHFRHKVLQDCDSWSEGETEWHYNWKQKFPLEWQEKTIERFGELHRADIQTSKGLVLELQNSSISSTTIKIREEFYSNMVWLVNAKNFKDNFVIRSLVTQKLRESNSDFYQYTNHTHNYKSEFLTDLEENLKRKEYEYKTINRDIDYICADLKSFLKEKEDFENILSQHIKGNYISTYFYDFKTEEKETIKKLDEEILKLSEELENRKKTIKKINSFPNCSIKEFSNWKILDFELIYPNSYTSCKVIFKDSLDTFFPEMIDIKTSIQFQSYSRTPEKYILILDLTNRVIAEEERVKSIEIEIEKSNTEIQNSRQSLSKKLSDWITTKEKEIRSKIRDKEKIRDVLERDIVEVGNQVDYYTEIANDKQNEDSKKASQEFEKEQLRIKIDNKGKYTYHWKNKRKTWEFADKPVYLDFGDCIFKIMNDYDLVKMKTEDFINFVKNN